MCLVVISLVQFYNLCNQSYTVITNIIQSAGQALLAAKAGATYVSPFVGRLDDICNDGVGMVAQIV